MSAPLWTWDEIMATTGARVDAGPVGWVKRSATQRLDTESQSVGSRKGLTQPTSEGRYISGISIDTRTLQPGDLFVALADARDGHEFVSAAFKAGAVAALVRTSFEHQSSDGTLFRVDDPLKALERLGIAARARLRPDARVIAVTGSAGKTTTKEMLRAGFSAVADKRTDGSARVHASEKSYNNHWGVPLTLARMPADTHYAIYEIGMNHAGEITPLTKMVRPHVAIITTVAAVHLEHFPDVEAIADAKAEIFSGLEPGGTAILPGYNRHFERLAAAARDQGAPVRTFGGPRVEQTVDLGITSSQYSAGPLGPQTIFAHFGDGGNIWFDLALRGDHMAVNALAAVLALQAAGADPIPIAVKAFATMGSLPGRGERTQLAMAQGPVLLIDECYNANPASMRAALSAMKTLSWKDAWTDQARRIAVLGDMLELGAHSDDLHRGLKTAIDGAGISLVFACGEKMKLVFDDLPPTRRGAWAATSAELEPMVLAAVQPGDVVMVKGSNGVKMARIVAALKRKV